MSEAVHSEDHVFHSARFVATYGALPKWGKIPGSYSYAFGAKETKPSLLNAFMPSGAMPLELVDLFKDVVPPPQPLFLRSIVETPTVLFSSDVDEEDETNTSSPLPLRAMATESSALADVLSMLRLVEAGKVKVSDKTGLPGNSTISAVRSVLSDVDYYDEPFVIGDSTLDHAEVGPIKSLAWPFVVEDVGSRVLGRRHVIFDACGH